VQPADVFISYSSRDRERADAACEALERDGIRCWIAPRDGAPGVDYASFLVAAIEQSRIVVLIFSRAANDSDAVLNELELAANRGIPVLPVRIEDVQPHGASEFYLRRRHWLDAHADFDRALESLAPAVRAALAQRVVVRPAEPRTRQRNLPRQTTTFVGRERDLVGVAELLSHGPLLTIVGPGGVGKTRLALQAATEFDDANERVDEAWFVDLAPLAGEGLVAGTILTTLGAGAGGREPLDALVEHLRDRRVLLVIDNCEHVVVETGSVVDAIVAACADVTIVATSREALNITGERVYRLHPFDVATAVGLFVERVRTVNPLFALTAQNMPIVEQICARLDGLPLAIELAAARVRVIAVDELSRRLSERFRLLTGGSRSALPHQQTMRALIDWSYDTLSDEERALLRRMAAFAGSFSLEAVSDVGGFDPLDAWEVLDRLASLVDKSLVTADVDDRGQRYSMLQSIQDYADERLAQSGERDETAHRHAAFFATFAHASYEEWDTSPGPDWLARNRAELDNLRAALRWTLTQGGDRCVGAQLAADAVPLFLRSSLLGEGLRWCEVALAIPDIDIGTSAQLHYGLSMLYNNRNAIATALEHVETAVAQFRQAGSKRRLTRALSQQAQQTARLGRHADAMAAAAEAIDAARRSGDLRLLAGTLQRCAMVFPPDQIERARAQFDESVRLFRGLGRDDETARALEWWATAEGNAECFERAIELAHEAAAQAVDDGDRLHRHNIVAACALAINDRERAAPAVRATLELAHAGNHPTFFAYATSYIAALCGEDDAELAARLVGFSETRFAALGAKLDITDSLRSERLAATLQSRLGDELVEKLRAEGALWDEQHAFAQASRI
jgi:predicted ATPase